MKNSINHIKNYFPVIDTFKTYRKEDFRGDLNAGITVAIMLIPQGMAYAVLAGLPPVYGLYASIIPLIIYAIFGTSRHLAVGPVAMVSLLVVAGVGDFAEAGTERFIQLAILTALGVGVIQFLMGIFKMGFLVNFLSHPVLSGFTSAAAIIIAVSQIPGLLGLEIARSNYVHEVIFRVFQQISDIDLITASIGIGSIAAIIIINKWKKTFPSALAVVIIGTVVTAFFDLHQAGVSIVGDIPQGFPDFDATWFNAADLGMLMPIILVIALVSYMESIAVAKAIANKRGYKIDADQELIALGSANIGGAFFQAFPTTGGFSRTAVNEQSGAKTTFASIYTAILILAAVLLLTPLFYYLPNAVLAAIIMVAVAGLFDIKEIIFLMKTDRKDLAMLLVTFAATLALGIEEGIAVGVILSLVMVIYSSSKPHSAELGRLGSTKTFRNLNRYPEAVKDENILILRFDSTLYFANVEHFRETFEEKINHRGSALELVILDASAMHDIDSTGIHTLQEFIKDLRLRRITFYISGAIGPVRDRLKKCGITEAMGEENFFFDVDDAVTFYKEQDEHQINNSFSPIQTNF